jgi:hypothetical protein
LFYAASSSTDTSHIRFDSDNTLHVFEYTTGFVWRLQTTQVFRDASAWYHIVVAVDTTQATASNRVKIYVNGAQITVFGTASYPSQNTDTEFNNTVGHAIGRNDQNGSNYLGAYLADIFWIDGQQLDPSSFTETDATTGQLIPLAYTGSYGTNGFRLTFSDNSGTTSTTLGKDSAGSNNFTPNNFSVSSGAGNDSLVDVPTNGAQTDTGVGGEVRGNCCTLNPLKYGGDIQAPTNGNLDVTSVGSATGKILGTIGVSSGKWYWECVPNSSASIAFGITKDNTVLANYPGQDPVDYSYHSDGSKYSNNSGSSYGATFTTNDIIGVAFDADNGTLTFYKNNSSQGQAYSGLTSGPYFPMVGDPSSTPDISATVNFGQRAFAYTAPSGFKALNTANLPAPAVVKSNTVFDVKLYTGSGSTQTISGLQFNPDFLWIKNRDSAGYNHHLTDIVRGVTQRLKSNTTGAELTTTDQVTAYTSTGFTLGADSAGPGDLECNQSSKTYVAWAWDAGSSTVTNNTAGTITPTGVRANATAGFSIVTWTGNATLNASIGHGLGAVPRIAFIKNRSTTTDWLVYTTLIDGTADFLKLNTTAAKADLSSNVATSTLYYLDNGSDMNGNGNNMVAYFFAPVVGYSSFGSFNPTGTSDSSFVYCGFRPRLLLVKQTTNTSNWIVWDTSRDSYNYASKELYPNLSDAEVVNSSTYSLDVVSNGFKMRNPGMSSGSTWIYCAWAEVPFNYARAR